MTDIVSDGAIARLTTITNPSPVLTGTVVSDGNVVRLTAIMGSARVIPDPNQVAPDRALTFADGDWSLFVDDNYLAAEAA